MIFLSNIFPHLLWYIFAAEVFILRQVQKAPADDMDALLAAAEAAGATAMAEDIGTFESTMGMSYHQYPLSGEC